MKTTTAASEMPRLRQPLLRGSTREASLKAAGSNHRKVETSLPLVGEMNELSFLRAPAAQDNV